MALIDHIKKPVNAVHGAAKVASSHALTVVYLLILAALLIPLGHVVWDYWRPTISSYTGSGTAAAPVRRGALH